MPRTRISKTIQMSLITLIGSFHESIDISKPSNISHQTTVRMLPVDSFDDHSQAIQGIQDKIHRIRIQFA